jgi:hypothetical protein
VHIASFSAFNEWYQKHNEKAPQFGRVKAWLENKFFLKNLTFIKI